MTRPRKQNDRRNNERRRREQAIAREKRQAERRTRARRTKPRVDLEIWVEERVGSDTYLRRTSNLSEQGVFFDVAVPSPVGTEVALRFSLPGDATPIEATGEVVSAGAGPSGLGMGIKFTRIDPASQQRIRAFVDRT